LSEILEALNEWAEEKGKNVHMVIEEAQELIKLKGYDILPSIAYAFDNLKNLNFIITGSEVRVKDKFLKLEDEDSPLFGRAHVEIIVNPFDKETAIKFLEERFKEQKVDFSDYGKIVEILGGNPGWLTYLGYVYIKKGKDEEKAILETKRYTNCFLRNFVISSRKEEEIKIGT
jgi:AAA+ ATPase superfamily predicted ATPase